ncbi:MAG: universal stress protein [Bacteroidales bacterium]|nr:universal stress protein [Bacteroidales bacterium]
MIKNILVPIDGSGLTEKIMAFAIDLAEKYQANVTLLSVLEKPSPTLINQGTLFTPNSTKKFVEDLEKYHKKVLLDATKKIEGKKSTVTISSMLVEGRPADKIIEVSQKGKYDLIVIGSRGLGGIKEFFLGSVSDRVADEATCPVLIIKG